MKILYFGQLREQLNLSEEQLSIPNSVHTVANLAKLLNDRGEAWTSALKHDGTVLVAINHEMGDWGSRVNDNDEVAFFPPMTGG